MKKKSLLFLLLMALFAPLAANAQETVTIGDLATATNNSYLPMNSLYDYSYTQQIYTADEIGMVGTINSITIWMNGNENLYEMPFDIYMVETDKDEFTSATDWVTVASSDIVYSGTVTVHNSDAEAFTFELASPFAYSGEGNLLIAINNTTGQWKSGLNGMVFGASSDPVRAIYARRDDAVYDPTSPTFSASATTYLRNVLEMDITPSAGVTCPKPANLTVSDITSSVAVVTWESEATSFYFEFKKSTEETWTPLQATNLFFTMADLEPNTTYNVRVKAICSVDPLNESTYATTQFTTPCGAITSFPWTEDFESYASGNFTDPCWVNEHISGSGTNVFKVYTSTNGTNSTHQLQLPDQSGGTLTKLVLPEMTLPGDNYEFMIDVYRSNSTYNSNNIYEGVRVYASTDGEIEGATELAFIPRQYNTGNDVIPEEEAIGWYTYELPIGISGTCYIILRGESQYCTSTYMDNFKVKQIPTCLPPTGLQVVEGSITSTGASFTWDAEEGATFQYYTIENPWEGFAPTEETSWTSTTNNSAGWANAFSPNTTQRFYLRKDCGSEGYSDYTYVEFRTLCGPTSLINGYAEDFNDDTYTPVSTSTGAPSGYPNVALPYCWQFLNLSESTSTYPQAFLTSSSTYAVSGNCLFFKSSNATPLYAILPEFVQDISEYQLTFTYRNEGTGNYNGKLYVGYMTDPSDASTFVQTLACEQTTTLTEETAYFANAPQGSFMAFKYEGGTSNNFYLSIDDVVVSNGPACFPTGTLDCVELSSTTATLSWTLIDFQQNAWVVEYSESPQFFEPVVSVDASQNWNFVIEGLEPETQYYARVRGNCGEGSLSDVSNTITFTTLESCPVPTNLVVSELSAYRVVISWDAEEDVMFQALMPGGQPTYPFDPTTPPTNWNVQPQTENFAVWDDLTPETTYGVWLRKYCGTDDQSDPIYIMFTTAEACPVPTNLAASNLTQNTADLSWTGSVDVESYMVWYRTAEQVVGIDEQFNSSTPSGWEVKTGLLSDVMGGAALSASSFPYWTFGTNNGVFDSHVRLNVYGTSCKSWLITPSHTVESGDVFTFDMALTAYSGNNVPSPATSGTDDRFVVLVTNDGGETWTILREWNNSGSDYVYNNIANSATGEQVSLNLNDYVDQSVRIAFYGESTASNADNNLHIDNVRIGTHYASGGDNFVQSSSTTLQLTGLIADRIYDVQVRSICNNDTWTDIYNFKTLDQNTKVFIGGQALDGYDVEEVGDKWWNPNNWVPYGMPSAFNDSPNEDVILRHDAVISINLITGRNIIADANSITFEGDPKPTLTLEDGNQLRLNTIIDQPDVITVKKNIIGYAGTKDQYYLISSPVQWLGQYNPANGIVTTESDYDLYAFDPAASDGLEWRNYKADPTNFKMDWGTGYLYANAADVMISVTGPVMDNKQPDEIFNYNYFENEDYQFNGWKLCGNTFTCNAYLSSDSQTMAFYRMNADGTGFEAVTSVIKPMEGFFLQNTVRGESVVLSRTAPSKGVRCLNLVLSQVAARRDGVSTGSTTLDNAIIRFDEGNTLEKLSFREGSSKIYMPVEGKDYAVVNAGQMGELPVSFKAEKNGSYTLSFTNEDVEFSYLHLIDNLTGNDVDLLANPSYSFEAKTTDYASRFRLVFATGTSVEGDNFSFVNASGNLCIFGIEGEATVQVIDILGHVISSETFSGSYERKINGAPGVYMVRLINGNDVKVQKVVVR